MWNNLEIWATHYCFHHTSPGYINIFYDSNESFMPEKAARLRRVQ